MPFDDSDDTLDLQESSKKKTTSGSLDDLSADEFGADEGTRHEDDLMAEPDTMVVLPIPYRTKDGRVIRSLTVRAMPHTAERILAEEGGNRVDRAKRSVRFLSLLCQEIGGKSRTPDTKDSADFFDDELMPMPIQDETYTIVRARMVSVHLPTSRISGRKYVFPQYCPNKNCDKSKLGFDSSIRLDQLPTKVLGDERALEPRAASGLGHTAKWRFLTVGDKVKILRLREDLGDDLAEGLLWLSLVDLDGNSKPTLSQVRELPRAFKNLLYSQMEEGGMRTRVSASCPACKTSWPTLLPWEHRSFFSPLEGESDEETTPTSSCRF